MENSFNDDLSSEVIDASIAEDEGLSNAKYLINSYGADYTVDSLVQRINRGDIYIPSFQRNYVWNINQASKFIESLLLGLPVPGIFLSKDDDRRLLVIDGQQRLRSLQRFYDEKFDNQVFALKNVREDFSRQTYSSLRDEDRRQLDDSILHATIIQQTSPENDDSSIYHIFERLNTGGAKLQPQEIRASVYFGPFIELLIQLNEVSAWRAIYGERNKRGKDQELILRFLALYFMSDNYQKPLSEFLNKFTKVNRNLEHTGARDFEAVFVNTIELIYSAVGKSAFRSQRVLNAAVFDAIMIGVARRLQHGPIIDTPKIKDAHDMLIHNSEFSSLYLASTTDEKNIATRIDIATKQFAEVK